MNLMLLSGCAEYDVLIYERCRFTHLNLEWITKCKIVYNHWRKSAKISYGWKTFAQSQNLEGRTQITVVLCIITIDVVMLCSLI